jgi:hypothetical protein
LKSRKSFGRSKDYETAKSGYESSEHANKSSGGLPEEIGNNGPSLAEIRQRAFEIHIERGDHVCDLDNYLDEWLQAERELKEKYSTSNDEGAKNK